MTPDQARHALEGLFTAFGEPHKVFGNDLWARTEAAMIQEYNRVGDAAFQKMIEDALAAVRVLASGNTSAPIPTSPPDAAGH